MSLIDDMVQRIKEEIDKDPEGVGYADKTDAEVATLLNGNVYVTRTVVDIMPPPVNRILSGLGSAPNTVTAIEVAVAKQVLAAEKAGKLPVVEPPIVTEGEVV